MTLEEARDRRQLALDVPCTAVTKGDARVHVIACASIIAKTTRDGIMEFLDRVHPEYEFARHKGYPTREHQAAIEEHGILTLHRKSFGPVKRLFMSGHVPRAVPPDALIALPTPQAATPETVAPSEPSQRPTAKKPPAVV